MLYYVIVHIIFMVQWSKCKRIESQEELVNMLSDPKHPQYIQSKLVKDVMLQVDRKYYVDKNPYENTPISIGYGATFPPASMNAIVLENLKEYLKEGNAVLDVGSGTGYMSVLLALMVGESGRVVSMEHIPELVNQSIQNIMNDKPYLLESGRLRFIAADARFGFRKEGPFDAVHIGALIKEEEGVPPVLLLKIKNGGRMVVPVNTYLPKNITTELLMIDKGDDKGLTYFWKNIACEPVCEYLTDKETQLARNLTPNCTV